MREINKIIIHCSATVEGVNVSAATIKRWHVQGRGWSDIGYHYVIGLDGAIEYGRPIKELERILKEKMNTLLVFVTSVD